MQDDKKEIYLWEVYKEVNWHSLTSHDSPEKILDKLRISK